MPRRKKSRMVSRAPPVRPKNLNLGHMEAEQLKEKFNLILADFDREVERRVRQMEDEIETVLQFIQQTYRTDLMRYPAATLNLPWKETEETSSNVRQSMAAILDSANCVIQSAAKKRGRQKKIAVDNLPGPGPAVSNSTRTTRQRSVLGLSQSDNMQPPASASRVLRNRKMNVEATPVNQGLSSAFMSSLYVTPKFDPRTPLPPGTVKRHPKMGEIAISLRGSPLQVSPVVKPTIGMEGWIASLDTENLDEETKHHLQTIQEKVQNLLKA